MGNDDPHSKGKIPAALPEGNDLLPLVDPINPRSGRTLGKAMIEKRLLYARGRLPLCLGLVEKPFILLGEGENLLNILFRSPYPARLSFHGSHPNLNRIEFGESTACPGAALEGEGGPLPLSSPRRSAAGFCRLLCAMACTETLSRIYPICPVGYGKGEDARDQSFSPMPQVTYSLPHWRGGFNLARCQRLATGIAVAL